MVTRSEQGRIGGKRIPIRTLKDLSIVANKLSAMFDTEVVVVVGSQSILVGWPGAPDALRESDEIDAYPANAQIWESAVNSALEQGEPNEEASERIHALCGEGSTFHEQWGFFIDGVNNKTSPLPERWQERAVYKEVPALDGKTVTVIAPCTEDMIATKLTRLVEKDKAFIKLYHLFKPLDVETMKSRLSTCDVHPAKKEAGARFLDTLPASDRNVRNDALRALKRLIPNYPQETHCVFLDPGSHTVVVRQWDAELQIYYKVDNPLGHAVCSKNASKYFIDGMSQDPEAWNSNPKVAAAMAGELTGPKPPWR